MKKTKDKYVGFRVTPVEKLLLRNTFGNMSNVREFVIFAATDPKGKELIKKAKQDEKDSQ